MTLLNKNPWIYYVIMPFAVGIVFGLLEAMRPDTSFRLIGHYFTRPIISALLIWVIMYPAMAIVCNGFHQKIKPLLLRQFLASILGAMPLCILLPWAYIQLGISLSAEDLSWMSVTEYDGVILERYLKILLAISVIWTPITYWWYAKQEARPVEPLNINPVGPIELTEPTEQTPPSIKTTPAFLDKMTKPIGRIPWAIKAEQHYIRIYTEKGDEMVLYRFSDAIKSLEEYDGLQVHRSYWVAKEAIEEVRPLEKSYEILLKNGVVVPVSRSNKKQVEMLQL